MSESDDPESKTEEATEKKLHDTLEKGKTPVSRDVTTAFGILALLIALNFLMPALTPRLVETLSLLLGNSGALSLRTDDDALRYSQFFFLELGRFLAPMLLAIILAGLAGSFVQGAPRFVFDRIEPDLARISPLAGWRRLFGLTGLVELAKTTLKIAIVGGAIIFAGRSERAELIDAMRSEPAQLPALTLRMLIHLTSAVAVAIGVLAFADFGWTRFKWRRDLRMSRQEIKEEFKQAEGDPFVKARMRSLAMDRARRRMMASVPKATMVVTNPTHYAIALRYRREQGGAPMVVAKGKDIVALKIREIAAEHGVPVIEKKDLARALFDIVEVDRMIPEEFYRPVAELIHFLNSTRR